MTERYAEFQIEVWGNTLLIKVIGPTGTAELEWLREQIATKYLPLLSPHWAILGDARQWELYTPEAKEMIADFTTWAEAQGMTFNLVLAPENSLKLAAAQELNMGDVIQHHYVFSMEEAIKWLTSKGVWGEQKQSD